MIKPLVIAGPSGIGKSTLIKQLIPYGFRPPLLTVTRPPRPNEIPGVDLEFLSIAEYKRDAEEGAFFMDNIVFGNFYGVRRTSVNNIISEGKVPLMALYLPVVHQFIAEYPNSETLFMNPSSLEFLFNRLNQRPQTFEELKFRFNKGLEELTLYYSGLYKLFKHEYKVESDDNSKIINYVRDLYPFVRGPEGNVRHHKER